MFVMVDYAKEMTVKSCKYGEYGSFEHLLFLLAKWERVHQFSKFVLHIV